MLYFTRGLKNIQAVFRYEGGIYSFVDSALHDCMTTGKCVSTFVYVGDHTPIERTNNST